MATYLRGLFRNPTDAEVQEVFRHNSQLDAEIKTLNSSNAALKRAQRDMLSEITDLKVDMRDARYLRQDQHDEHIKECSQLRKENSKIRDQHEQLRIRSTKLLADANKALESRKVYKAECHQLQQRCHEASQALEKANGEADKARTQLTRFKSSLSTLTKAKSQITDGEVCSKVDQMFYSIQDFALKASRCGTFEIGNLRKNDSEWLRSFILDAETLPKALNPYIIATLVSQYLVTRFDPEYYFGNSSDQLVGAVAQIAKAAYTKDVSETKAWLEPTRRLLTLIDYPMLQESDALHITDAVEEIGRTLGPPLSNKWDDKAEASLRKITTSAFELFRMLQQSNAVFRMNFTGATLPGGECYFSPELMQAVASAEEDSILDGRQIQMLVFPGIFKFGDEMGNNQDEMTVICKARVVPQKESHPAGSMK
ncbi:hypothetical protein LTS10_008989 [Elasticomyces elasticus]|nr:hypothetical protein LTS10_008989 [Elasticomyces elasticus]